jgi:TetR/AcrR family transcriptional regulator, fatty acid metabolism regulator protein
VTEAARRIVVRLPRARREQDILDAAHEVFVRHGYEAASMSEIAEMAGVVEGTIYKYFDGKRALLYRVIGRWYEAMLADHAEQLAGHRGTRARLRFVIWRHVASIRDNPALCQLFFREIRGDPEYRGSAIHELNRRYTHAVVEILREGAASGEVRAGVPFALVRDMIYGAVEHQTWAYVSGQGSLDADAVADRLVDLVLGGAAPVPDAATERLEALVTRLERAVS